MISKIAVFISAFSDLSKALFLIPPAKISKFSPPPFSREAWVRRRFVVRIIEPWQTCFSAMPHQISHLQFVRLRIMATLQRGLSRAYFTYDRDCDGRLRPSPFREGIGVKGCGGRFHPRLPARNHHPLSRIPPAKIINFCHLPFQGRQGSALFLHFAAHTLHQSKALHSV